MMQYRCIMHQSIGHRVALWLSPLTHHEIWGGNTRKSRFTITTSICRQSMLQTLTLFPQFARDGTPLTSTIYSLTDKVTAHAAALLLAPHRRKAYMARDWKREWIPRAIENVRTLWRKRYKDKVPIVHLWVESQRNRGERSINYLADWRRIRFLYWRQSRSSRWKGDIIKLVAWRSSTTHLS